MRVNPDHPDAPAYLQVVENLRASLGSVRDSLGPDGREMVEGMLAGRRAPGDAAAVSEAHVLREAAAIFIRRSSRPRSFWLGVVVRLLRSTADDIETEEALRR